MKKYLLILSLLSNAVLANTQDDPHLPISHCYHWLNESTNKFLSFKYQYASEHDKELTFFTTPATSNGSVAGAGLYCGKSPVCSYDYGDRVIRVDFVKDVVLLDGITGKKYCGHDGKFYPTQAECDSKPWDVKFYSGGSKGQAWYVIGNPMAISEWSANSQKLQNDLTANIKVTTDSRYIVHATKTLEAIQKEAATTYVNQKSRLDILDIINKYPENLAKIPPVSIIERVVLLSEDKISAYVKNALIRQQLVRILKDNNLAYSDISSTLKNSKDIREQLLEVLASLSNKEVINSNFHILANTIIEFNQQGVIDEALFSTLWGKVLSNSTQTQYFLSEPIQKNDAIIKSLSNALEALSKNREFVDTLKFISIKNISDQYLSKKYSDDLIFKIFKLYDSQVTQETTKSPLEKFIIKSGNENIILSGNEGKFPVEQCKIQMTYKKVDVTNMTLAYQDIEIPFNNCQDIQEKIRILKNAATMEPRIVGKLSFIVKGSFEETNYTFVGNTVENFSSQCKTFYDNNKFRRIDEIYYSVNDSELEKDYKSTGYYDDKNQVCNRFIQLLSKSKIPNQSYLDFKEASNQTKEKIYFISGDMNGNYYTFGGPTIDDISIQCEAFHENGNIGNIDRINFSINDGSLKQDYRLSGYYTDKKQVCNRLAQLLLKNKVPSKSYLALLDLQKQTKEKFYFISGEMNDNFYIFGGSNTDDISTQCEIFHDKGKIGNIDRINFSVNDGALNTDYKSSGYYTDKKQVCNRLSQLLSKNKVPTKRLVNLIEANKQTKENFYLISGEMNGFFYLLGGTTTDEIFSQCEAFYEKEEIKSIDRIRFSVNDGILNEDYKKEGYYTDKKQACGRLIQLIGQKVI